MIYITCYFLIIGTDISHQFGNPFFGTLAQSFHFCQWLCVCAMKTGTSYFGNLFSTCQQVLGHACHIWYSLWLKSHWPITIQHMPAQWWSIVSWRACLAGSERAARVSQSTGDFSNGLRLVCNIINMMPYNGCSQMLHISLKTEKSFIAHPWRLLCVVGLEEYSAHDWRAATSGTARSRYLSRVAPVVWLAQSN